MPEPTRWLETRASGPLCPNEREVALSGATGSIRGEIVRLSAIRRARNGRDFAVAILRAYSHRQKATFSWKVVVFGRSLEMARRLPIGARVVAKGEIFAQPATDPRHSMSMACRDLIPAEEPRRRRNRAPAAGMDPRAQAEAIFAPPRQMALDL